MKHPKLNKQWSDDVVNLFQHDMEQFWDRKLSCHQWNQYKNQLETYLDIPDNTKKLDILDVGCAQATLALLLAENGHNVAAVDIRQEFLKYAATRHEHGNIEFIHGNVLDLKLTKKFDLIYANQIIEHLVHPNEMINCLSGMLKKEGKLVITTPNGEYFINKLPSFTELGDTKKWEDKQFTADGDGHFFAYRVNELVNIFKNNDFICIEPKVFETPIISGHLKFRFLHKFIPYRCLKILDQILLNIPILKNRLSHQLMIIAVK